jgi:hypothetical protein
MPDETPRPAEWQRAERRQEIESSRSALSYPIWHLARKPLTTFFAIAAKANGVGGDMGPVAQHRMGEGSTETAGSAGATAVSRRNKNKQPPAVWLYRHTMKSDAWQALSVGARATYIELCANYNTNMQNAVYLSIRTGAEKLGADKKTVIRWLHELLHYGFIVMVERGTIGVYGYGRATQYRLTDRPYAGSAATYAFKNWTGELFNPEPDGGRKWRPKKQKPGPLEGPPRSTGRTIRKPGQPKSLWSTGRTIRKAPDRSAGRTITSVANSQALKADVAVASAAAGQTEPGIPMEPVAMSALMVWSTPALTEIPYTDELRRLYRNAAPTDDGLAIPEFLRRI